MRLRYVRCAVPGIGRVYGCPGILRAFPFLQHPHDILCNIHADGTTEGVIVESNLALGVRARYIAGIIRCMTNLSTTAITGDFFHYIRVGRREPISRLYRRWRRLNFGRHLAHRHHVQVGSFGLRRTGGDCSGQ